MLRGYLTPLSIAVFLLASAVLVPHPGGVLPIPISSASTAADPLVQSELSARDSRPADPLVIADSSGPVGPRAAVPVTSFEGLIFGANGPYTNRYVPPDVQVAAGPNHVVEMVNALGRIWTKQGTVLETFTLHTFFGVASTDFISDPKVRFDGSGGRWFATIADVTTASILLEVSTSDDPTSTWNPYAFLASAGCADQPLLGISDDTVVLSANDFSSCTVRNPSYVGVEYWVVNKADLLGGATARFSRFGPDSSRFSLQPAHAFSSTTAYLVTAGSGLTTILAVFAVTGVPPGTVSIAEHDLAIRPTAGPPSASQAGSNGALDTGDARVEDAFWDAGRLWVALNDACIPSGDVGTRSCVRLIEVDTGTWAVEQDFDFGITDKYVFYPALRTDGGGRLFVVFGFSSSTEYPGVMVAIRSASDPPDSLGAPQVIRRGDGPVVTGCSGSRCRYGDYFGAGRDPSDPEIVWVAGEYGATAGWATYIAAMSATVRLTVSYALVGGGTGFRAPTFTYVQDGVTKTASLTATQTTYALDGGTPWSVPQMLPGSGASERWATDSNGTGNATASLTIVFTYAHQYLETFAYRVTGGGAGFGAPNASYMGVGRAFESTANFTDWADAGSSYAFAPSLPGSNATERWYVDPSTAGGTVSGSGTVDVLYRHQAFVTFDLQGPAGGTVSPGTGWYDVGASISPSVAGPAGWAAGEWIGSGPGAYSGPEPTPALTVSGPFSETAILFPGLTIAAGFGGVSYRYEGGTGTVPGGSSRTIYVRPGTIVSLVETSASAFTFAGWSGGTSGMQSNVSVTIEVPTQVRANFALTTSAAIALVSLFGGLVLGLVLLVGVVRRRRRTSGPPPTVPPPPSP
ncbi:MAG TPA: hypothetical protein VF992_04775 [Thermoplasmata archaeon]